MAPANYYSKREPRPNYAAAYAETSRPKPPPPPMGVRFPAASSGGKSRKFQQICSYHYSPAESMVCWTPVVAATIETVTVIPGYEAAGKLLGGAGAGATLMDNYYNQH
nr:hypothetical protein Iba_scaffold564943CG0010 [Ipomoea batatas]